MEAIVKSDSFNHVNFTVWRENNVYIEKDTILELLTTDIINYFNQYLSHAMTNGLQLTSELYIGYVIYSKIEVNLGKIANILNLLIQNINPDR